MAFASIPEELRALPQWICWRRAVTEDGKPTKLPLRALDGKLASVTDPRDWSSFNVAVQSAQFCDGIGFLFTSGDAYCGFDFDATEDATTLETQRQIVAYLNSYSELSPSGTGLHVITRAKLPGTGKRRGKIECYDNGRFFTFTGNVVHDLPIADRQAESEAVWRSLFNHTQTIEITNFGQDAETNTDVEILDKAAAASNGDKFLRLWSGDWQTDYGEKSQSEADFALINILGFYSRNGAQITRLFRKSGLGQRDKAARGPYVGIMVRRAFDRMPKLVQAVWGFQAADYEPWDKPVPLHLTGPYVPPVGREPVIQLPPPPSELPPIPGLVGKLMQHCWHLSTYPVAEVAIASALTSMAVLTSRTYRLGTRGLSLYVLLIAKTSIGKSFAYQAQHAWVNALIKRFADPSGGAQYKARREFLEGMVTGKIASGPGLAQHMLRNPQTLAQLDELTKALRRMSHPNASANDTALEEELLSLVDSSKPGAIYREKRYSDRATKKEPITVQSACFSFLGTGTPEDFYDDITSGILEGGLMPRITLLEYDGTLPEKNHNEIHEVSRDLIDELAHHFNKSFALNQDINGDINQIQNVAMDAAGKAALDSWERYCENQVRLAHKMNTPTAGLWSRAQMHVSQIAALIAIGVNPHVPTITLEHVNLALGIVEPGLRRLCGRIVGGEAGQGDTRAEAEIRACVRRIGREGLGFINVHVPAEIASTPYIPVSTIRHYCTKRAPFARHKLGSSRAFEDTINSMIRHGDFERKEFVTAMGRKLQAVLPLFT